MVLMNASNKARYSKSITNQNQGGGDKKAGFPHMIGRESWESVALGTTRNGSGPFCYCKLSTYQTSLFPKVNVSLPVGFDSRIRMR